MRLTLRAKLLTIVASTLLGFVIVIVTSALVARDVQSQLVKVESRHIPKLELGPQMASELTSLRRGYQDAVAAHDLEALERTTLLRDRLLAHLVERRDVLDPNAITAFRNALTEYHDVAMQVSRRMMQGEGGEELVDSIALMQRRQAAAQETLDRLTAFEKEDLEAAFRAARAAQEAGSRQRLWIMVVSLAGLLILVLVISRSVVRSLERLQEGFARFGKGAFEQKIPVNEVKDDELAEVATQANRMADNLATQAADRDKADAIKNALIALGQDLRGDLDQTEVAVRATRNLTKSIGAPAGAFYVVDEDDHRNDNDNEGKPDNASRGHLSLLSHYALAVDDVIPKFAIGEGLVGEAARSLDITVIDDVPENHLRIRSGLGEIVPTAIVLVPIVHDGHVSGILELALTKSLTDSHRELLRRASESIAVALSVARARSATRSLATRLLAKNSDLEEMGKSLEAKAAELATMSGYKSQFLANMSHELRTPLNSMLLLSKLLSDNGEGNLTTKQVEYARTVHSAGRDLLLLINQVLDLAKIESGKQDLRLETVSLRELVTRVGQVFNPLASSKGLALNVDVADDVPTSIATDPLRVRQILTNLIGNAIKFTEEGKIRLYVRKVAERKMIAFEVTDSGHGIPSQHHARIFAPFEQVDTGRDRQRGGTGLGLSIAREFAQLLGGELSLLRSDADRGSTFVFYLPETPPVVDGVVFEKVTADEPPVAVVLRTPPPPMRPVASNQLLVIEDDPAFADILRDIVEARGLRYLHAKDGVSGLRLARERVPVGILLDVRLPDLDGWHVMEKLRSDPRTADIPVQFISAIEMEDRGLAMGAVGYLTKPAAHEELVRAVEAVSPKTTTAAARSRGATGVSSAGVDLRLDGKKLLVVDDDMRTVYALAATLRAKGAEVLVADTGLAALDVIAEHPDVAGVLMDIMMPGMDGFEATRRIRLQPSFAKLPIITLTAKAMKGDEERCLEAGATAYLPKPVDADALLSVLRTHVTHVTHVTKPTPPTTTH